MKSDQPTSLAPLLTTTTLADWTERSTPSCGVSRSPPINCGPSTPAAMVAELQARLSTLRPATDCSVAAYASDDRWQAVSTGLGLATGALPMPAAVESPMTTASTSVRFGPEGAGTW